MIELKDRTYYVAEVSHRETNPVHRVICSHHYDGLVYLYSAGYSSEEKHYTKDIYHFEVVNEIEEMNKKPSRHKK